MQSDWQGVMAIGAMFMCAAVGSGAVPVEPPVNAWLSYESPQAWTARVQVDVMAFEDSTVNSIEIQSWEIDTLAMIFPLITETSAAVGDPGSVKSEFRVGGRAYSDEFTVIDGYQSGASYARWDAEGLSRVRRVTVVVEPSVRSWETTLDEEKAGRVGWPEGDWPTAARSTFDPQYGVEFVGDEEPTYAAVDRLLERWTGGNDPKSIQPLVLAKFLAGKVQETVQPTGSGLRGQQTSRRRGFQGFAVQGMEATLRSGRGSPFDMVAALAGVYRRAGLPARTVIGLREYDPYDTNDVTENELEGESGLHAYVEFFLYDEASGDQGWIPVDILQLRRNGSRAQPLEREWAFFGTHDELDYFIPLSLHFHPPTTVRAYGSPGLWGWFVTPVTPAMAFQKLTFASYNTPVRGGQQPARGTD
jgi:hypothetical protein